MEGLKCNNCGKLYALPKCLCTECDNGELKIVDLVGEGEVFSYTTIRVPPLGLEDQAPYDLLLVKLNEGINITGRLVKEEGKKEEIKIGKKVSFVGKSNSINYFKLLPD